MSTLIHANGASTTNGNGSAQNVSSMNNIEKLVFRLCSKVASINNLNEKSREEFLNKSYAYMVKLFCSDAFTPVYDTFEVSQKIKKKLVNRNRIIDASAFSELESRLIKLKILKNQACLLQFFLTYYIEQSKYETISSKNSLLMNNRSVEAPVLFDNLNENLVDKSTTSKKLIDLFKNDTNEIPREVQRLKPTLNLNEGFILRELIYALQGVDGKLFQKDPKDMQLIIIKTEMERSTRMHVMRYLECGWLYLRLRKFLSTYNNNPSVGLVLQAFCAYISAELKEYHRLLAVLESQLENKDEGADCRNLTLRRLLVWLEQPLDRLKYLNIVCDAIREKKGGILLSTLYAYSIHGDQFKSSLLKSGLAKCLIPIRDMILEWICDGQIRDIHEEFFVAFDNTVSNDRLWHDKYNLRVQQIPTFITESQARKILVIGKSINFLRVICNEQKQIKAIKNPPSIESMLDQKTNGQFQEMIDLAYEDTSSTLIEILMKKYKLLDHFNSLRRYLLLGQGDFIRHLMDLMESELSKPATDLMSHNLKRLLDKAITETNAQFDPPYIISNLDVRLLTTSPNDMGWDVFSLDYNMNGPLKTIFTTNCLLRYLRIFNFLWRVKRMEYTTCATWRSQKADMEKFRTMPEIYEIIHQSNIICSEMLRLVQNLNFYIMFEVLEVSWKNLCEKLNEAKDMDDVIAANEHFLDTIISQLLLDTKSVEIASELRTIFDLMVKISSLNDSFHKLALCEYDARKEYQQKGFDGMSETDIEAIEKAERKRYHTEVRPKIKSTKNQMSLLKTSFTELVRKLLEMLKNHHNESLRFLSFRFNFNEYYN